MNLLRKAKLSSWLAGRLAASPPNLRSSSATRFASSSYSSSSSSSSSSPCSSSSRSNSIPSILRAANKNLFHPPNSSSGGAAPAFFVPRRSYAYYYYSGPGPEVQRFRRRQRWYHNPRAVFAVVVVSGAAGVSVYYGNLEPVPYTNRKHFVLISPAVERQLGEAQFEQLKAALRGKILPPLHPDSVRVRLICKEIVQALQRGLRHDERRWSDMEYGSDHPRGELLPYPEQARDAVMALSSGREEGNWGRKDEVLDDEWIHESRKDAERRGEKPMTKHLDGLNWEVVVVRDDMVNAMCLPGGKIVVFTGLLDHFRTDADIATVIGHEVAHAVARHAAEGITKNLWLAILQIVLFQFFGMPDLINAMSNLLLRLPFSRRMEMEADYIGLLLLAAAGYDPRVAPKVYKKLGEITGDSALRDYLSTHPSSKKRAQLLSQSKIMNEALEIYQESVAGRGVEGFL